MIFSWLTTPVRWDWDDHPDRYDWAPTPRCAQCGDPTGSDAMSWCSEKCQSNYRAQNRKEAA